MLPVYQPPKYPRLCPLYQDEHILVLDKPSGLLSVPGRLADYHDSILSRVRENHPQAEAVHRLDMATSGVMLIALSKMAERELKRQFRQREPEKNYQALVWGHPAAAQGVIDLPLICDWPKRPKQKVCHDTGKAARTEWQVLDYLTDNTTRLLLIPYTGRSHQLRVHMQALGHPILGDRFYATGEALARSDRLLLHASRLGVNHPLTGEWMVFLSVPEF